MFHPTPILTKVTNIKWELYAEFAASDANALFPKPSALSAPGVVY